MLGIGIVSIGKNLSVYGTLTVGGCAIVYNLVNIAAR